MWIFTASVCAVMSPYVSKREARISGMVTVGRPVPLSIKSVRHWKYISVLIFWMMVRLAGLQRFNFPMISLCRRTASDIWNCVELGTGMSGPE